MWPLLLGEAGELLILGGILSPELAAAGAVEAGALLSLGRKLASSGEDARVNYFQGPHSAEGLPWLVGRAGEAGAVGDSIDIGTYDPRQHTGCGVGTKPSPGGEGCIPCGAGERPIPGAASGCEPIPTTPPRTNTSTNTIPRNVPAPYLYVGPSYQATTPPGANVDPTPAAETAPAPEPKKSDWGAAAVAGGILFLLYFGNQKKKRRR